MDFPLDQQPLVSAGWKYQEAEDHAYRLEELLGKHGVKINPGSHLETAVLKVAKLTERARSDHLTEATEDLRDIYRTVAGLHDLAGQLLSVEGHADFPQLVPHLELLNAGHALQNLPSPGRDQATNKVFELFLATQAMHCGDNLVLEAPDTSDGRNPDILVSIGGRRWGIACKVFHGATPEGFAQLLLKGIDQIEKSPADVGVVAFNTKNILDHDAYWPLAGIPRAPFVPIPWPDPQIPFQLLHNDLVAHGQRLIQHLPEDYLLQMVAGKKSLPGALLWGSTVSGAMIGGAPTVVNPRLTAFLNWGTVSDADRRVLECLHCAAFPDSQHRGARPAV